MPQTAPPISQNRSDSGLRVEKRLSSMSGIFPRRTLLALAVVAAVLLGLLLWTAIAPDRLLFSLA